MGADHAIPPLLDPWYEMAESGLSTWAEETAYWRSLCHVWSAHPSLYFLNTVVGLRPTAPGCRALVVEPHPSGLAHAEGSIATPRGPARAAWSREGNAFRITIALPEGTTAQARLPGGRRMEVGPEGLDTTVSVG
jgi:hypothetical protein